MAGTSRVRPIDRGHHPKESFSVEEVARFCGAPVRTIYRRIEEGGLKTFRPGGGKILRVAREELVRFLGRCGMTVPEEFADPRPRLLVVDDDEAVVRSLRRFFTGEPRLQVEFATSGLGAGIALKSFRPSVMLLDIALGDIDGRELFRTLRQDPDLAAVRVLAFSGVLGGDEIPNLLAQGFEGYVAKPCDPRKLVEVVLETLGRAAARS